MSSAPSVIMWSSEYLHQHQHAPRDVAVQVWTDSEDFTDLTIKELAEAGYQLIFSNIDGAYLDCGYAGWVTDGNNWCSPYRGWQAVYDNSPRQMYRDLGGDQDKESLILGGEAAMWSEQVDSAAVVHKLWPRVSAP